MAFSQGNTAQDNGSRDNRDYRGNNARDEQDNSGGWSYFGSGNGTHGISATSSSDYFMRFLENAKKRVQTVNKDLDLRLIPLDRDVFEKLHYSAVAIAVMLKNRPELGLAYHTILLEATGEDLAPIRETYGAQGSRGKEVEVMLTASAGLDDELDAIVRQAIQSEFGNVAMQGVEGTAVPRDFDPDEQNHLQRLLFNSVQSCTTELDMMRSDFLMTNMGKMKKDGYFATEIVFAPQQFPDASQRPMRSDVSINLSIRRKGSDEGRRNRSIHSTENELKLTSLSAFIDISPIRQLGRRSMMRRRDAEREIPFGATCVITDVVTRNQPTPENVLLAISTVPALNVNSGWTNTFRPRPLPAGEKIDTADVGALNIQGNLQNEPTCGSMVDSRDELANMDDLGQFIGSLVEPDMMVAIDIPEYGPQSWYLSFLAAAAAGREEAIKVVLGAANTLTDNRFSHYFREGDRIFAGQPIRIHAGTMEKANGQLQDLRYVDYLYAANTYGTRDHVYIADWTDTFLRTDFPEDMRLDGRLKQLQALTGQTAKVTGYFQRLFLSRAFLEAINSGLEDCGVSPRLSSNEDMGGVGNNRGYASFYEDAMLSGASRYGSSNRGYGGDRNGRGSYTGRYR